MRVIIALSIVFICFFSVLAHAQNDAVSDDDIRQALHGGGPAPQSRALPPPAASNDGEDDSNQLQAVGAPGPQPQGSLSSLRDAQMQADRASNGEESSSQEHPALTPEQADATGGYCQAKDVAFSMTLPDNLSYLDTDKKRENCTNAYDKLTNNCAPEAKCVECAAALKAYTSACSYVNTPDQEDSFSMRSSSSGRQDTSVKHIPYSGGGRR